MRQLHVPDYLQAPWNDYDEYRRETSPRKWTYKAQEIALRRLKQFAAEGHDPTAVVEQTILNGWSGLWPVRDVRYVNGRKETPRDRLNASIAKAMADTDLAPNVRYLFPGSLD